MFRIKEDILSEMEVFALVISYNLEVLFAAGAAEDATLKLF